MRNLSFELFFIVIIFVPTVILQNKNVHMDIYGYISYIIIQCLYMFIYIYIYSYIKNFLPGIIIISFNLFFVRVSTM